MTWFWRNTDLVGCVLRCVYHDGCSKARRRSKIPKIVKGVIPAARAELTVLNVTSSRTRGGGFLTTLTINDPLADELNRSPGLAREYKIW